MVVKGKKLTLKDYWEKLKKELQGMETRQEKLEHLWTYYKWVPAVFLIFVAIISIIISAIISLNTETILAGGIINVPVSPEGYAMLWISGLIADGQYHTLEIDLTKSPYWNGEIHQIRFDFINASAVGDVIYIKSISLE